MNSSDKSPNEFAINYRDTIDYDNDTKVPLNTTDNDAVNTSNLDTISVGTEEPLNVVMGK